jgi:hypothetical protein
MPLRKGKAKSPKENPKTNTVTKEDQMVEAYNKGQSIQSIAEQHDITSTEVIAVVVN